MDIAPSAMCWASTTEFSRRSHSAFAPLAPDFAIHRFEVADELGAIQQWRLLHSLAHACADFSEPFWIVGEAYGDVDVLVFGLAAELGQADAGEHRQAHAGRMRPA